MCFMEFYSDSRTNLGVIRHHAYHVEHSILGSRLSVRVWVRQNFQKTHTCSVRVCGAKSYCAQSVRVCQNWLHTNTMDQSFSPGVNISPKELVID